MNDGGSPGWAFFKLWLQDPLGMAALSPSGPRLARAMVKGLGGEHVKVVEFGAGTGVFTQALLDCGVRPENLLVIELKAQLVALLQRRFPQVQVVCADARDALDVISAHRHCAPGEVDAIVSGLGLLSMPVALREQVVTVATALLKRSGVMRQFTYGPGFPVAADRIAALGLQARRVEYIWLNLPPASVYEISR